MLAVGQVAGEHLKAAPGGADAWLVQVDADGVVQRSLVWGTAGDDRATAVAVAPDGRVVVGGETRGAQAEGKTGVFVSVLGPVRGGLASEGVTPVAVLPDPLPPSSHEGITAPTQLERDFVVFRRAGGRAAPGFCCQACQA